MPDSVLIAAFVFGAVLLFLALVGGGFKLFGAEFSGTAGKPARVFAGILGILLIFIGLVNAVEDNQNVNEPTKEEVESNPPDPTKSRKPEPQLNDIVVEESLAGTWVGSVTLLEEQPNAFLGVRLEVDSRGKINLDKSYVKDVENLNESPRMVLEGELSHANGLHFQYNNPTGVIGAIDSDELKFLNKDVLNVEGTIAIFLNKEDVSRSNPRYKLKMIIKLVRQPL